MADLQSLLNKRAIDVTVDELASVIAAKLSGTTSQECKERRLVRGIPGIMEIFQCSRSKASEIRNFGIIDKAITVSGRVFLVDVEKALDLMNKTKGGRHYGTYRP